MPKIMILRKRILSFVCLPTCAMRNKNASVVDLGLTTMQEKFHLKS